MYVTGVSIKMLFSFSIVTFYNLMYTASIILQYKIQLFQKQNMGSHNPKGKKENAMQNREKSLKIKKVNKIKIKLVMLKQFSTCYKICTLHPPFGNLLIHFANEN